MDYLVRYEINIEADNVEEAALEGERILNNMAFRPTLEVIDESTGETVLIDLEELEVKE